MTSRSGTKAAPARAAGAAARLGCFLSKIRAAMIPSS